MTSAFNEGIIPPTNSPSRNLPTKSIVIWEAKACGMKATAAIVREIASVLR
ncbi:hypothetical protein D3C84_1077240 [compost metagenome]